MISVLLTGILLSMAMLTGCAGENKENAGEDRQEEADLQQTAENNETEEPETISVLVMDNDNFRDLELFVKDFEAEHNIKVNLEILQESAQVPKMQLVLSSEGSDYDVIAASNKTIGQIVSGDWCQPLDEYLNDPAWTGEDYDYMDHIEGARTALSSQDGKVFGLPYFSETNILYYNKAMFEEAGITKPPKTFAEVEEYAKLLHKPEKDQYGIVYRASREGNANSYSWLFFFLAQGGTWHMQGYPDYEVAASPEAITAANNWVNMLKNYSTPGISTYGFEECSTAFKQGKAAMFLDASVYSVMYEDPEQCSVAGDVGYVALDEGNDSKTVCVTWGWVMPKNAQHKEAAWEFMKWSTSKEFYQKEIEAGNRNAFTRSSTLNSPAFKDNFNGEWATAFEDALSRAYSEYTPSIAEGTQIRETIGIALSKALSDQMEVEPAMQEAEAEIERILE